MNRPPDLLVHRRFSTLFASFLYFDMSFAVWVLFGALGNFVAADFHLQPWQKGLLVAIPILAGSLFRILLGWSETHLGGKRAALTGLGLTAIPLLWGWRAATHFWELPAIGILLGVAGASFAVALPMASRWFSPKNQGLVLGLAGAGNSGTLLATLFGPYLASRFGWHTVFGLALLPILATFLIVLFVAQDAPRTGASADGGSQFRDVLRLPDTGLFCLLYAITFGGFIGFTSFLGFFFFDQYGTSKVSAGLLQTLVVAAGSFLRPVGGHLADRLGGRRVLCCLFVVAALCGVLTGCFLPLPVEVGLFFAFLGSLGMGNGAVFQLVGTRLALHIGVVTGLIGAAGGIGGFLLPICLGAAQSTAHSYAPGLLMYASLLAVAAAVSVGNRMPSKLGLLLLLLIGLLFAAPMSASSQDAEEILVEKQEANRKLWPSFPVTKQPNTRKPASGSWFLSIGTGTGFPQYDRGDLVNEATGAVEPLHANASEAFTALVSTGYRWFDPQRWGHWSFDVDFVGAYLGTSISSSAMPGRDQINLGFLGLRGRAGYRVLRDRFEPFVGFAGGGVLVNVETSGVNHGDVWGYWFAPTTGLRYYIPGTRWSITAEGLFRFLGDVNGFDGTGPGVTMNETPHVGLDGGWIYVPLGVVAIGYRF